jgi:hypothetical protein
MKLNAPMNAPVIITDYSENQFKVSERILMDAIPLCLLLNKLDLFSLTQHRFIKYFRIAF